MSALQYKERPGGVIPIIPSKSGIFYWVSDSSLEPEDLFIYVEEGILKSKPRRHFKAYISLEDLRSAFPKETAMKYTEEDLRRKVKELEVDCLIITFVEGESKVTREIVLT